MTFLAAFKRAVTVGTRVRVDVDGAPHCSITGDVVEVTGGSFTVLGWTDRSPAVAGQPGGRYKLNIQYRWPERSGYVEHIDATRLVWTNPRRSRDTLTILPKESP